MTKKVVIIVTGSIAAVKVPELIRLLKERGASVTCVLTTGGEQFITPLSLASLSGNHVYQELFSLTDELEMGHIELSRRHDVIAVVPASANFIANMAYGFADDLATSVILASDKPVLVAPAMNVKMWEHPATQRNIAQLRADGVEVIGPAKGDLACGEEGLGRMEEPEAVADAIVALAGAKEAPKTLPYGPLSGKRAVVTSGPTREKIDPVRYISNASSGKQGHAIAEALRSQGADVVLISGPTTIPDPVGVETVHVESAKEMLDATRDALPADIAVCTAAVADWSVAQFSEQKIKKTREGEDFTLVFAENPDILYEISKPGKQRPELVIGFAAESEHVVENARVKLQKKGCDWIIANNVVEHDVFDNEENKVHVISKDGQEDWPKLSKKEVADQLAVRIVDYFKPQRRLEIVS